MNRFEGMILCSDVDGTLVDEQNNVPKENIEAIAYFQAHGGKFMLATGRIPEAVTPILDGIHPDLPGICHNGCSIYDYNKMEYVATTELPRSATAPAEEIMRLFPESGVEIITVDGIYILKPNFATERHITFEKITSKPAESFESVSATWLKFLFAQDPDDTTKMQEAMKHSPFKEDFTLIRTHQYYYEIFNKNASKGNAVKQLFKLYDISPENFYAIGDNDNDVEMLELAGVSAAVANASASAKAAANNVMTKTNEQGGVAEFIASL
ncbi:MAG: HAD family hydrolase [Clostridia bacterium]|nr:HAD family hydrolase [Clostridia bacterium]